MGPEKQMRKTEKEDEERKPTEETTANEKKVAEEDLTYYTERILPGQWSLYSKFCWTAIRQGQTYAVVGGTHTQSLPITSHF